MQVVDPAALRNRALRSGIAGSLGVRAVAVLAPLLLIPMNLSYLGPALFGLWATLTAVGAVTTFSDLGMGNGLLTLLPGSLARGERREARALVSSAYGLLIAVSVGVLALLLATFPFVPWETIFDPDRTLNHSSVRLVVAVSLALTAIGAPLSLCFRLYYATQRAHLAAVWTSAVILSPLVPVLLGVRFRLSPFLVVVVLVACGPLTQLFATVWLFTRVAPELRPNPRLVSRALVGRLFRLGAFFLILSVALVLGTSFDNLLLTHSVGLAAVTAFAIPAKVFAQLAQGISLINLPLWAAHGDALARGDRRWVSRTTKRMVVISAGAAALASTAAVVAGPPLLRLWLGRPVELPVGLLIALGLTLVATSALSPLFMIQNAAGAVVPQIIGWGLFAVATLPAKYLATRAWGYEVLPWFTLAGLLLLVAPPCVGSARVVLEGIGKGTAE